MQFYLLKSDIKKWKRHFLFNFQKLALQWKHSVEIDENTPPV